MLRAFVPVGLVVALGAAGIGALEGPPPPAVTFTEHIAPIVYQNCVTCHRAGEAAPFPLITYDDVKKHAKTIVKVTESRYMPPWHATHGFGDFADERRLTDEQIATIADWFNHGMPEGDPAKLPALAKFPDGWHLGTPDLVLKMPVGFDLPASGPDVYRNFIVPTNLTEDKWVRAIEFRPSARKAVHHVLFAYDASHSLADGLFARRGARGDSDPRDPALGLGQRDDRRRKRRERNRREHPSDLLSQRDPRMDATRSRVLGCRIHTRLVPALLDRI